MIVLFTYGINGFAFEISSFEAFKPLPILPIICWSNGC